MKIDRVEAINLRYEYPNANGYQYGGGICTGRVTTLILVHTDPEGRKSAESISSSSSFSERVSGSL